MQKNTFFNFRLSLLVFYSVVILLNVQTTKANALSIAARENRVTSCISAINQSNLYRVTQNDKLIFSTNNKGNAIKCAIQYDYSRVIYKGKVVWNWHGPYYVYQNNTFIEMYRTKADAIKKAMQVKAAIIKLKGTIIWSYPILGSKSYNHQINNLISQKGAREAFNQIVKDVDLYGSQLDDFDSVNAASFNSLISSVVQKIGSVDKDMHYFRNKLNRCPASLDDMVSYCLSHSDKKWKMLDPQEAAYHMNGYKGEWNLKFVSPDGHFEAVYSSLTKELITDPENMGTYNYISSIDAAGHLKYDVSPWYEWGNIKSQEINRPFLEGFQIDNLKAEDNLAKYFENKLAQDQRLYYFHYIYPEIKP